MASVQHEPVTGVCGHSPQRSPGAERPIFHFFSLPGASAAREIWRLLEKNSFARLRGFRPLSPMACIVYNVYAYGQNSAEEIRSRLSTTGAGGGEVSTSYDRTEAF